MRTLRSRRGGGNAANNGSTTTAASSLVIVEDETATETGRSSTSQMTRPREHLQRRAKDKVYADRLAGTARQALVSVAILYLLQTNTCCILCHLFNDGVCISYYHL